MQDVWIAWKHVMTTLSQRPSKLMLLMFCLLVAALLAGGEQQLHAAQFVDFPNPESYVWSVVTSGLNEPVHVTGAGDDSGRLFVLEQAGIIRVVSAEQVLLDEPFLDFSAMLLHETMRGQAPVGTAVGLAFHPEFTTNGTFFVSFLDGVGSLVIMRYQVSTDDPNRADGASGSTVMAISGEDGEPTGGFIEFNAEGMLFIGVGEDLESGQMSQAQNPRSLLGKLLRIDVDVEGRPYRTPRNNAVLFSPGTREEIYASGLQRPTRFGFDRFTDDLYIADSGEQWQEVTILQPGMVASNFGWALFDGSEPHVSGAALDSHTPPVFTYRTVEGDHIVGGYVFREVDSLLELHGHYFFADSRGNVRVAVRDPNGLWQTQVWQQSQGTILGFGQDDTGRLYLVTREGELKRLIAVAP
jgi:glucose/arabinose dehydrogenase